ncbi:MFS transporter [Spiribacter sp. 2438]|uniref:MFS transporter n=1 Tax=Spiribacter sp. 2438 TaxID=2666185 RepID=UPI0012AFA1E6|nr:MFS transporter [Spiribacter sp. 2438]QGM21520.1 MFS transporter [Spiribacter sp. 2438]
MTSGHGQAAPSTPVIILLLWGAGLYLRLTVMVAPPLAPVIAEDLGLGEALTGSLTTLPILMLAVAGIGASFLISRIGARNTLIIALCLVALTSAMRGAGETVTLFIATAAMGFAIAAIQPALPTLITQWWPTRIALGTAVYMNGMLVGEVLGSTLTIPLMLPLADGNWRLAILLWSMPALLPALALLLFSRSPARDRDDSGRWMPEWRKPLVWRLGALLGASGALFFGSNAYLGSVLGARGESDLLALGLILLNGTQLLASLLMFRLARFWTGRSAPLILLMLLGITSLTLFVLVPGYPGLAMLFPAGLAAGMMLILMAGLPPLYARGTETAALAAGMFGIGAIINFAVPLGGGLVADITGAPGAAIVPILVYSALVVPLARGLPPLPR